MMPFFQQFFALYMEKSGNKIIEPLKKLGIQKPELFISVVLEWYFFAMFYFIVNRGGDVNSRARFADLAKSEYPEIDTRAIQLVLSGLHVMRAVADSGNKIAGIYLNAETWPTDSEIFAAEMSNQNVESDRQFWIATGSALEPVRGIMEGAAEFGEVLISGVYGSKKIVIIGAIMAIIFIFAKVKK